MKFIAFCHECTKTLWFTSKKYCTKCEAERARMEEAKKATREWKDSLRTVRWNGSDAQMFGRAARSGVSSSSSRSAAYPYVRSGEDSSMDVINTAIVYDIVTSNDYSSPSSFDSGCSSSYDSSSSFDSGSCSNDSF